MRKKMLISAFIALLGCSSSVSPPNPATPLVKKEEAKKADLPKYETNFTVHGFTIRRTGSSYPVFRYLSDSAVGYYSGLFPDLCELDLGDVQIKDRFCDKAADAATINGKLYQDESFAGEVKTKTDIIYKGHWGEMGVDAGKAEFDEMRSSKTLDKYLKK